MPRRIKLNVGDREVDAVEVDFSVKREEWNEYVLDDGGRVRLKTTPSKIYWVLDSAGKRTVDKQGDPVLAVMHTTQVISSSN